MVGDILSPRRDSIRRERPLVNGTIERFREWERGNRLDSGQGRKRRAVSPKAKKLPSSAQRIDELLSRLDILVRQLDQLRSGR